ncbi:MAG: glycosyltransferase [Clostridia bacterium]|nr:glycosyltransferase [Clostridia bacterium]
MKKILIVNNNMNVGGVQKSLYNLLWSIHELNKYDITLLLFDKDGEYTEKLPDGIKVIECGGPFRFLGKSQSEFKKNKIDFIVRSFFAGISRIFGRSLALRLMILFQPKLKEEFDVAVSFIHNGRRKAFYGGVQEYVLSCVKAKKKVAFLHCDYSQCGANHKENNKMMFKFDKIAACSDGCRKVFESVLPQLKDKCITVRNCHRFEEVKENADEKSMVYDSDFINVITVARLSHEKGIDRGIKAVEYCLKKGIKLRLHIVGGGVEYESLKELAESLKISENVVFYGEKSNPYRYMKNADLFLLTSYHEAAPMVIDEARCLGLPVLTTETTSSNEMVTEEGAGWVCENSQESLNETLFQILSHKELLFGLKNRISKQQVNNNKAISRLDELFSI